MIVDGLDTRLLDVLNERVAFLLARIPESSDPDEVFSHPDSFDELLRDPGLSRALGWIEGLADARDLTVLELLDETGISTEARPPQRS